jgi:uncharacterized protein (TIGR02266 family)
MSQNTRKDPRAKVLTMTVRYRSATIDEFIEHHSYDVSRGGMFIKTPSPFPAGTLLKFEVKIAEDQKVMQGVGRVVWKREQSEADADKPGGMGVKFIKIDEESRAIIERLLKSRAPGGEGAYDSGPVPAPGQSMPPSASAPPAGPVFPATSGSERPPEDRTVLKPAAELLQDALQQAGSAGTALPAIEPSFTAPEASVETKRSSDRSEPPPPAEEAAAAAWAHDALTSLPDKDSVAPPSSRRAGAVAVAKEKEATPVPAAVAETSPARASTAPPTPERRPSRRPSRPPLAEVEEEGGGGKAVLLLLVAAAVAAGIYFLTKRGHEVPPEPSPPAAVQAEPTSPPAPSPAPEVTPAPSAVAPEPTADAAPTADAPPAASVAPAPAESVAAPETTKPVPKAPRAPRPKAAPKPAAPKEEAPVEAEQPSEPAPAEPAPEPKAPEPAPAPAPTPKETTPSAAPQTENPY